MYVNNILLYFRVVALVAQVLHSFTVPLHLLTKVVDPLLLHKVMSVLINPLHHSILQSWLHHLFLSVSINSI